MDNDCITRIEHEEFRRVCEAEHKRIDEENERQNHRLSELEAMIKNINDLTISISQQTQSIKVLTEEVKQQGARLEKLEAKDGEMWRKVVYYVLSVIIGACLGLVFSKFGIK